MTVDIEARQRRIKRTVLMLVLMACMFYGGFILMTALAPR